MMPIFMSAKTTAMRATTITTTMIQMRNPPPFPEAGASKSTNQVEK